MSLDALFDTIIAPTADDVAETVYAVLPVPSYRSYFVGKDSGSRACLLVTTVDRALRQSPPIRLENLDVQFELPCHLKKEHGPEEEGRFTIIRCRSIDRETVRYFLSVCDTVVRMVGDEPGQRAVGSAVHRLAEIFQKIQKPPARTVNGLFGELYLISRSANPAKALTAWRVDETSRFDFVDGAARLDVKTASGRVRHHIFSYEQCNPPTGTIAIVASMFVERVSLGLTLRLLVDEIATIVASQLDLVLKLHDVTASTLGNSLSEAMAVAFDENIARSSLRFFGLTDLPAIRCPLPMGVSDVCFCSDLSISKAVSVVSLIEREPTFLDLLPRQNET